MTRNFASRVKALAKRTRTAHSFDRYTPTSWQACAAMLLRNGYTDQQAETLLRSILTRWAADYDARPGRATSMDLKRCIERCYPNGLPLALYKKRESRES